MKEERTKDRKKKEKRSPLHDFEYGNFNANIKHEF